MQQFIIRDKEGTEVSRVSAVLSCTLQEKLEGENALKFATLMKDGLETMTEGQNYTIEFETEQYDVVSFKKTVSGSLAVIEFDCEHISYRLNNYKLDNFSGTGTPRQIVSMLLNGTEFSVGSQMASGSVTYSSQESATIRKILLDFANQLGQEVLFSNLSVSFVPHRGAAEDAKILDGNVLEISKTVNVLSDTVSYTLQMKPKIPVNVGDEVHLVFRRLGIDEKVRVLAKTRTPFISDNITLEVGAYVPTLESESVQVMTDMVSKSSTYYGARISADNGIEINRADGNAKVIFNADRMAFYQGSEEVLFFDPIERKWKMSASVEVHVRNGSGVDSTITALADSLTSRIEDADNHFVEIQQTLEGLTVTTESGETKIDGGMIITQNLQLQRLIAKGSPNSYVEMLTNGLNFVLGNANTIGIGYASAAIPMPYMIFGEGASPKSDESGMIKFYENGLWLGDSADRHSTEIVSGTGLFVDIPRDKVYVYLKGEAAEVTTQADVMVLLNKLKDEINKRIDNLNPVAVFG